MKIPLARRYLPSEPTEKTLLVNVKLKEQKNETNNPPHHRGHPVIRSRSF